MKGGGAPIALKIRIHTGRLRKGSSISGENRPSDKGDHLDVVS